jgi:hypothetical protein
LCALLDIKLPTGVENQDVGCPVRESTRSHLPPGHSPNLVVFLVHNNHNFVRASHVLLSLTNLIIKESENQHPLYYKAPVQVLTILLFFRSVVGVTPGREFMKYPGYKFEKLERSRARR